MNIFVGNLSYEATEAQLEREFERYGEVDSVKIISDRETGRSRGFGFVEMRNRQEGRSAVQGLNEADIAGRNIVVNEARPRR